jgi:hypothetical protein
MISPAKTLKKDNAGSVSKISLNTVATKKSTTSSQKVLREVEYSTMINVLRDIEGRLELGCEIFDMVKECSKHSIKIKTEFAETMRKAEADRKHQKYLD